MGSGCERLVGSDVGERPRSAYRSVLGFRGSETEHEKLASAMLIGDRIPQEFAGLQVPGRVILPSIRR